MALLDLRKVSKSFGAIKALTDVDLQIDKGEIVGLMGDNGAGKSTMVKLIAGNFPPTTGEIVLDGEVVHFHKPVEARAKGIEVVYQDLALCNNLSAAANVFLGREIKKSAGPVKWLDHRGHDQEGGRALRRAQIRDAAARSRPPDVGRPAPGRRHRPDPPLRSPRSC